MSPKSFRRGVGILSNGSINKIDSVIGSLTVSEK